MNTHALVDPFCQLVQPVGHVILIGENEPLRLQLMERGLTIQTFYGDWGSVWPDSICGDWFLAPDVLHKGCDTKVDFVLQKIVSHIRIGGLIDVPTTPERTPMWWAQRAMGHFRYTRDFSPDTSRVTMFMRRDKAVL